MKEEEVKGITEENKAVYAFKIGSRISVARGRNVQLLQRAIICGWMTRILYPDKNMK